ncbi:MAG: glycosyltransferase [Bacteroidales bacterium]|nr:glycosyltransferase [Candidatus Cacconaster merdequi]
MKITILGTAHPYRGGLAVYNERLARECQAEGHDVEIKTFTLQYPKFLFPGKTQFSDEMAPEDLKIERCLNSINPFNWLKVGRKIRKERPDILIIKFWLPYMAPCLGTVARIVKRNGVTKVVSILDNLIPHEKRFGDRLLAGYFCGGADRFVAMSESVLADIDLFDKHKPRRLCPHPLYDNFGAPVSRSEACERLGLDPTDKILLSFGLIRDYKGLDWLLKAFASIEERKGVKLVVAGEFYSDGAKYHQLARSLNIDDEVIWKTEFVPDSDVKYYFCAADLIVQPYKTATQSGVTQIAYHFEKPMLVTRVGGLSEIVPDGKVGYSVEPSPEAVADALRRFLKDTPDFTEGIREEKRKYSWKNMVEAVKG